MSALPAVVQAPDVDAHHVNLTTAVQQVKATRAAMADLEQEHKRLQARLWDAEESIRRALEAMQEQRVVLGEDLIEVVETTPGRTVVLVSHVLVLP